MFKIIYPIWGIYYIYARQIAIALQLFDVKNILYLGRNNSAMPGINLMCSTCFTVFVISRNIGSHNKSFIIFKNVLIGISRIYVI